MSTPDTRLTSKLGDFTQSQLNPNIPVLMWSGVKGTTIGLVNQDTTKTLTVARKPNFRIGGSDTADIPPVASVTMDGGSSLWGLAPDGTLPTLVIPGGVNWTPSATPSGWFSSLYYNPSGTYAPGDTVIGVFDVSTFGSVELVVKSVVAAGLLLTFDYALDPAISQIVQSGAEEIPIGYQLDLRLPFVGPFVRVTVTNSTLATATANIQVNGSNTALQNAEFNGLPFQDYFPGVVVPATSSNTLRNLPLIAGGIAYLNFQASGTLSGAVIRIISIHRDVTLSTIVFENVPNTAGYINASLVVPGTPLQLWLINNAAGAYTATVSLTRAYSA